MRRNRLLGYVALVSVGGLALLVSALLRLRLAWFDRRMGMLAVLATVLVVGELRPIRISHRDDESDEVTVSSSFALALTLAGPLVVALIAQSLAVAVADVRQRKQAFKAMFNIGQYAVTVTLTRAAYCAVSGRAFDTDPRLLRSVDLPAALVAAIVFFLVNTTITTIAIAWSLDEPVHSRLRHHLAHHLKTSGVLLALAPAVLQAAQFSPWLVPLLLMPIAAVHRSAGLAVERERQSLHDALTALPNRSLLRELITDRLEDNQHTGARSAVLLIDLDHFKEINDTLGHHVGDELLRQVAARLQHAIREGDTVARLGGDEFAVLAGAAHDERDAVGLAARLIESLEKPFGLGPVRLDVQASIGISLSPDHGEDVDTLLQRADVALYAAKEERGGYTLYSPDDDLHSVERLGLVGDLRRAVEERRLVVHYQPKCDAASGQLVGVEALVRWPHPNLGLVPPDEFITVAENTGLIGPLTAVVLDEALSQTRQWWDAGHPVNVAVNLSARQLTDLELPVRVAEALDRARLPGSALTVEVTESTLMSDGSRAAVVLGRLRELGVLIAVDDFGTGYSSLSFLSSLTVDEIKIDKSFVGNLGRGGSDEVIVRSTIELGHSLGLRVVAEGVETRDAWDTLLPLGCDVIQGYFISRPLPPIALTRWLVARAGEEAGTAKPLAIVRGMPC